MPLGLLKCMITWFTAHLSEDESKSILRINLEDSFANKSLAQLFCASGCALVFQVKPLLKSSKKTCRSFSIAGFLFCMNKLRRMLNSPTSDWICNIVTDRTLVYRRKIQLPSTTCLHHLLSPKALGIMTLHTLVG